MNKNFIKLITVAVSVVIALVVVVASSYAWLSLSAAPSVSGLQINIGGKNTILIAPDVIKTVEGEKVHYPGAFSDTLNFSKAAGYEYLRELVELAPVSTADGVNWYFPNYSESGSANEEDKYLLDNSLLYGNLAQLPDNRVVQGGYAYIDFWVVSPSRCSLRVSAGAGNGGSYLVGLPTPIENKSSGHTLDFSAQGAATYARVGFLANDQKVTDFSMNEYTKSGEYDDKYRYLKGIYSEKGNYPNSYPSNFTIYEPNADRHNENGVYTPSSDGLEYKLCPDGSYIITRPIGNVNGVIGPVDVSSNTTVQRATNWIKTDDQYLLEQMFQAYLKGTHSDDTKEMANEFYRNYLGYQCGTLLEKGAFIKRTNDLIRAADKNGIVDPELFSGISSAGATDDVIIIELEKNVPQRIRMFVWTEGQDVDCSNTKASGGILLNLELAGSNS